MSTQLTLGENFEAQLKGFERRIAQKREYAGMKLWARVFRHVQAAFQRRDKAVQQELMLIEHDIKQGDHARALERVERLKTLMSCVCLGIVMAGICSVDTPARRGRGRSGGERTNTQLTQRVVRTRQIRDLEVAA